MQVRLLGPVDVSVGGVPRPVSGLRRKAVLAVLGLHRGDIVSTDRLVDVVWGDAAPPTAANTLQSHVSHLRRILGSRSAIVARPPGYALALDGEVTDVAVAERLIAQGTRAAEPAARADRLAAALALWRGQPLVDVAGLRWLADQGARLDHLRLQATRALVEARLALGEHEQLVPELRRLTGEHPFDEQFTGQLMRALYRSGRQADALAVFRQLRRTLDEELGIAPGQPLRDLESAMLRQDPELAPAPPPIAVPTAGSAGPIRLAGAAGVAGPAREGAAVGGEWVPAQLPLAVRAFTGRTEELTALDASLPTLADAARELVGDPAGGAVSVVCGTAGVGKTALVVHWAHRVATRFTDGQLYVDLRGFDPAGAALDPAEAVRGFLAAFGVPAERVPSTPDAQTALYRSLLAGRRVLVVLDNARDAEQVRPLLPGSAGCHVVVTSRDDLAGLVAREGARRISLDVLHTDEALHLLRVLVGYGDDEAAAAISLTGQCARLPLALRIAADLAVGRPGVRIADLVRELAGEQRRLDLLDAGSDRATALRSVFSWSERQLPPTANRLFWLLGLHPGPDLHVDAIAALAGAEPAEAHALVDLLGSAHLVERTAADRWMMHDLLRVFARERAEAQLADADRSAALTRLYTFYLGHSAAAMDLVLPEARHRSGTKPRPADTTRARAGACVLADPATARAWLEAERANLVALVHAADNRRADLTTLAVDIARTVGEYLAVGYHNADAFAVHRRVLTAAQGGGDPAGQARALLELAHAHARGGDYADARDHAEQALRLYRALGDRDGEARSRKQLGLNEARQGRFPTALVHYRAALELHRLTGNRSEEAFTLASLGKADWIQGRHPAAVARYEQAVAIFTELGHRVGLGRILNDLGNVLETQRRYDEAHDAHRRALGYLQEVGDRAAAACSLTDLGRIHSKSGRHHEALDHHRRALATFREIEDPTGEAEVLVDLGGAYHRMGQYADAADHHRMAHALAVDLGDLRIRCEARNGEGRALSELDQPEAALALHRQAHEHASAIDNREYQARALAGIAAAHERTGDHAAARAAYAEALEIFTALSLPDAADLRAHLAKPVAVAVAGVATGSATRTATVRTGP